MAATTASGAFPYLRSCKEESDKAIDGQLNGEIPKWLKGSLLRVGPGLMEVGPDRCLHTFDGMAMMHRFGFQDGKVTYQNRFLRSDTYKRNMRANRIVQSEFAVRGAPDPCKTIFQKFASLFKMEEVTDNDMVNFISFSGEVYAASEVESIWKIDPNSLESIEKVGLSKYLPIDMAIAHAHEDSDGTVYNVGSKYGMTCSYSILKFPPKANKEENAFQKASVVCKIDGVKRLNVSYHHSFGMTENYFVFVEQPIFFSIPKMMTGSFADAMQWDENSPCRFHVVRRSDGKLLDTAYLSKSFFVFHHINTYEENGQLVVDMCCYDDSGILKSLYLKALEDLFNHPEKETNSSFASRARRYVLPLDVAEGNAPEDKNLVTLPNCEATAFRHPDGSIHCAPEILTGTGEWAAELPRINYERFNGKKYRYFYALARNDSFQREQLMKADTETKTVLTWHEEGVMPSEPVFIAQPGETNPDEDSGILLASLLYKNDESKVSMLVLDAKTMKEIGRTTFQTKSSVPADFHGIFIQK